MVFAQGHGVSATLVGVPDRSPRNGQSGSLIRDADHHLVLSTEVLARHVALRPAPVPISSAGPPVPALDQISASVRSLAEAVVLDARFAEREEVVDPRGRLTKAADRLLVQLLAERTGSFPVDPDVLRSARAVCLAVAGRRWAVGELAGTRS
jgi:hypothetical protein